MDPILADLLAQTDPETGPVWTSWRSKIRPALADYLDRAGDPDAGDVRRAELGRFFASFEVLDGFFGVWPEDQRPDLSAQNFFSVPSGWEIHEIEVTNASDRGGRLVVAASGSWPPFRIHRIVAYAGSRGGVPLSRLVSFVQPAYGPLLVGLPDRIAPPVEVAIRFWHGGSTWRATVPLSAPGWSERSVIAKRIRARHS